MNVSAVKSFGKPEFPVWKGAEALLVRSFSFAELLNSGFLVARGFHFSGFAPEIPGKCLRFCG